MCSRMVSDTANRLLKRTNSEGSPSAAEKKSSAVPLFRSGHMSAICARPSKGKGRKSEGGNHWYLPSCAPAGEAGFSRFASENPNFWNDNENPLKRRTIDFANLPYSFEPIHQKFITRDSDAKYKTKTDAIHVCNRKTAQTGRKKEPCFRTAPQKFTSADIHWRTARQARLHARGCLLQCRSCCP